MKLTSVCLSLVLTLLWLPNAQALTDRAHLEKWCNAGSVAAAGRCIGYLLAAEDVLSSDSIEGVRACLPRHIKLSEQHGLVARAYAQHYPCP